MSILFNSKDHARTVRARKVAEQMADTRAQPKIIVTDGNGNEIAATVAEFGAAGILASCGWHTRRQLTHLEFERVSHRRVMAKRAASNGELVKPKKKRVSRKKVIDAAI